MMKAYLFTDFPIPLILRCKTPSLRLRNEELWFGYLCPEKKWTGMKEKAHTKGIANPHTRSQRIVNSLGRFNNL